MNEIKINYFEDFSGILSGNVSSLCVVEEFILPNFNFYEHLTGKLWPYVKSKTGFPVVLEKWCGQECLVKITSICVYRHVLGV